MCYCQIQRAPHGRPWPIVVENAWHVGQHDRHQVKNTIMVEKSFLQEKLWWMAVGCFVWRVTFGENTTRRGSASPYSQGRKLADTRLVGSCQVTWFHLIAVPWEVVGIYAKCQGRKLQVWSWPYSGESNLGCVPSSIIFESGCSGDHSWHFPVDKGRCRPHEGSSEWSYLENQIVTSWLINDKRRVAAGRHFLRTWHGTWVLQRRTRSFLT